MGIDHILSRSLLCYNPVTTTLAGIVLAINKLCKKKLNIQPNITGATRC